MGAEIAQMLGPTASLVDGYRACIERIQSIASELDLTIEV